jgi:hypothetical protein
MKIKSATKNEILQLAEKARFALDDLKARSAWDKGVKIYAYDLLEHMERDADYWCNYLESEKFFLNGARDWKEYSWSGCSLIYDGHIATRLCTISELKKTRYGERKPNKNEEWLDTQARALFQAHKIVDNLLKSVIEVYNTCELYDKIIELIPAEHIDHHYSDLYVKVSETSREIINKYECRNLVTVFIDNINHEKWFDIPFAYMGQN